MRFVEPSLLIWGLLAAVPIVLYLVRPRPRTYRTTTLAFFKSLSRAYHENAWLRRLKQLLSLLISLAVVGALCFALAKLVVSPTTGELKTVVVLLDRSASMQAVGKENVGDGSAFARAQTAIKSKLAGLPSGVSVVVIAYDRRPELILSRTQDRRAIERALSGVTVRPMAGDAERALRLAGDLAAMDLPAVIWHVSDHAPRPGETGDEAQSAVDAATAEKRAVEANADGTVAGDSDFGDRVAKELRAVAELPEGVTLEQVVVGHRRATNAGVTALEIRHAPFSRVLHEAFVQIESSNVEPAEAELEVLIDGKLIDLRKNLKLQAGRSERLLLPLEAASEREGLLTVRVKLPDDVFPLDDVAYARIPRARPLKVLWISKVRDPFTELALTSLGHDYDVSVGGPENWPPAELPSVAIFDGWTPEKWPTNIPAVVLNPPASFGAVSVVRLKDDGTFLDRIRPTQPGHPLLYGVASDRVSVVQTLVFDARGMLEPLWVSPKAEPLLAIGTVHGQKLVVLGFEPAKSESLPLLASYPLLIGNAVNWAGQDALDDESGRNHRTGDLIELGEQREVSWLAAADAKSESKAAGVASANETEPQTESVETASGRWYELERVGPWRTASGRHGTSSLLAGNETRLTVESDTAPAGSSLGFMRLDGDLTIPLLWFVLALLVTESWLFHRRAVY